MVKHLNWELGIGYVIDAYLRVQDKKEQDVMAIVVGDEGSGKSFTILRCLQHIEEKTGRIITIDHVAGSIKEFAMAVNKKGPKSTFVLDEARELEGLNFYKKEVKAFQKWMTKVRIKGHFYFMAVTNPGRLLGYLKLDKVDFMIYMVEPGVGKLYSKPKLDLVMDVLDKQRRLSNINYVKPNFVSYVPVYNGHLLEAYKAKKMVWVNEADDDFLEEIGALKKDKALSDTKKVNNKMSVTDFILEHPGMSSDQYAKAYKVSRATWFRLKKEESQNSLSEIGNETALEGLIPSQNELKDEQSQDY